VTRLGGSRLLASDADSFLWWDWVTRHLDDVRDRTLEHLELTLIALGVGFAISVALAVVALRFRPAYPPITWVTGLLYTIPSLALFGFLVPITGLGTTTAEIGLVSYTLLILVRNIVAGVDGVPAAVTEAADGMGYTRWRGGGGGGRRVGAAPHKPSTCGWRRPPSSPACGSPP
jgi:osmoprotectant transport system permease protein